MSFSPLAAAAAAAAAEDDDDDTSHSTTTTSTAVANAIKRAQAQQKQQQQQQQMESKKAKELRVRLRRVKPSSSAGAAVTASVGAAAEKTKVLMSACARTMPMASNSSSSGGTGVNFAALGSSDEESEGGANNAVAASSDPLMHVDDDDFATVHFKLAAALEAAAAHASGLSFDWQSMKSALIAEAKSAFKAKEAAAAAAKAAAPDLSVAAAVIAAAAAAANCDEVETDADAAPPVVATSSSSCAAEAEVNTGSHCSTSSSKYKISFSSSSEVEEEAEEDNEGGDGDADYDEEAPQSDDDEDGIVVVDETDDEDDRELDIISAMQLSSTSATAVGSLSAARPGRGGAERAAVGSGCISVVEDSNPTLALSKILALPAFDPHAPHLQVQLVIKGIVSLSQLSLRENNEIEVEIKRSRIVEYTQSALNDRALSPFMDFSNIHVKHSNDEFFTFCSCINCVEYREIVIHIMVEQFKAAHMVVMLLDVLIQAYGPMLKNVTAYNKFEKLLDANKEIYWIACGFVYSKKVDHMDFIYDASLSDNMIFVLFSSILMVNNPLLLLQILSFHVECIVKAYAEGFLEIVEPDNNKIPAEEMLTYILDGYDDLCRISDQISCYLFAFENDFLRKFSLTWTLLCQRLYQQHVYLNLTDTMLACIITLKEDELTTQHAALIKKYIQFDDKMNYIDKRWTDVWIELNKFNLSEAERNRRKCLWDVYLIFDTVVQDAIAFSLQESGDDNDFYDFESLENRRLAWQNIMAYTKMKWPDGFFEPPNTLVCDEKCIKCGVMLEYHVEHCKCITCSIAGGPLPPRRNPESTCYKCLAHLLVEKEVNFYESKILNVCASDDFLSFVKNNGGGKRKNSSTQLEELCDEASTSTSSTEDKSLSGAVAVVASVLSGADDSNDDNGIYHLAWAVFHHFNDRKRYRHATIEEQYFCSDDCKLPSCLLARKILNNEISQTLSLHLVRYYQPLSMSREELRSILPNIMLYNRKMVAWNIDIDLRDVHDLVVKIYWTFIISLYATYFLSFDEDCPLNVDSLEILNNDVGVCGDRLVGNEEDTKFVEFLDKIQSLSPFKSEVESDFAFTVDVHTEEIQNKLDNFFNIHKKHQNPPSNEKAPPQTKIPNAIETAPIPAESVPKKSCKEKSKKCCFDHSDLGDHCKENHSGKKRIKKECNHARMNETRDRLRKKLSQLVNARKNMKTAADQQPPQQGQQQQQQNPNSQGSVQQNISNSSTKQQQPPSLKSAATVAALAANYKANSNGAAAAASKIVVAPAAADDDEDDSLECLSTLCKRITNLHTSKAATSNAAAASQQQQQQQHYNKKTTTVQQQPAVRKSLPASSTNLIKDTSTSSSSGGGGNIVNPKPSKAQLNQTTAAATAIVPLPTTTAASKTAVAVTAAASSTSAAANNGLDMVSEIYEFLDNYSKDQTKVKKWINDTLSYIEGTGSTGAGGGGAQGSSGAPGSFGGSGRGGKLAQPQPNNPKKAAKKAKQKLRKEEEKRIAELQDLGAQFSDIYFKEFAEKHVLKTLKMCNAGGKKRVDKRRISELEANIKKLQRAKAKVETAILEHIATVKQTNAEFKFAYLPTKQQQLDKIKEMDVESTSTADATLHQQQHQHQQHASLHTTATNNLNVPSAGGNYGAASAAGSGNYSLPDARTNFFPYPVQPPHHHHQHQQQHHHMDFHSAAAAASGVAGATYGMIRPPLPPQTPTPMCYAPPQQQHHPQQQLSPDVVAAMAANAATDPSKRIVTIRRVNLPNVPEPQVTVTAKGSSPDKDKLLYTFVNGQLVQTTGGGGGATTTTSMQPPLPPPMTQLPLNVLSQPPLSEHHLLAMPPPPPPPPPPPLSKTQMKKERRRLAKQAAEEAQAAAELAAEQHRIEQERRRQLELEHEKQAAAIAAAKQSQAAAAASSKVKSKDKKKKKPTKVQTIQLKVASESLATEADIVVVSTTTSTNKNVKKKTKNQKPGAAVSSTTLTGNDAALKSQTNSNASAAQRRTTSTTTSCSAASSTSATPISSQVNTRDNSVCSLKPPTGMTAAHTSSKPTKKGKFNEQHAKAVLPPPLQLKTTPLKPQQEQQLKKIKLPQAQQQTAPVITVVAPPAVPKIKIERTKRLKLVDNGQFDNNPFKSLHMQDSETDCDDEDGHSDSDSNCSDAEAAAAEGLDSFVVPEQATTLRPIAELPVPQPIKQPRAVTSTPKTVTPEQHHRKEAVASKSSSASASSQQKTRERNSGAKAPSPQQLQQKRDINSSSSSRGARTESALQQQHRSAGQGGGGVGSARHLHNEQQQSSSSRHSKQQKSPTEANKSSSSASSTAAVAGSKRNDNRGSSSNLHQTSGSSSKRGAARSDRNSRHGTGGGFGAVNTQQRDGGGTRSSNSRHQTEQQQSLHASSSHNSDGNKPQLSKRAQKQALRNKKFQKGGVGSGNHSGPGYDDCYAGIPNNMGYFNPNDVAIPPHSKPQPYTAASASAVATQQYTHSLAQQMQGLRIGQQQQPQMTATPAPSYAMIGGNYQMTGVVGSSTLNRTPTNASGAGGANQVSIMDQLSRGVQVENLSLPPGITLTKVDPIKSEMLRQKSESIKQLSKPLQPQQHSQIPAGSSYYGLPYAGVAAAAAMEQSGIIMVEAHPPTAAKHPTPARPNVAAAASAAANSKTSRNKKRRNKPKAEGSGGGGTRSSGGHSNATQAADADVGHHQPKMITLRNPMFHGGGPTGAASAASMLQQPSLPGLIAGAGGGLPNVPAPMPMDQPAAIIKNENGMFTIRNPALHQAVTNGLALGGYRQFGNVNYYTPQEAAAEAARATHLSATAAAAAAGAGGAAVGGSSGNGGAAESISSFSYFSNSANNTPTQMVSSTSSSSSNNNTHNTISISCTSVGSGGGLSGEAAVIARPTPPPQPKCISAIGSEIKSAQQQKQKSKESQQWSNFGGGQDLPAAMPINAVDQLACGSGYLGGAGSVGVGASVVGAGGGGGSLPSNTVLQDKYQQSSYYNGFDVFPTKGSSGQISSSGGAHSSNTGSLFDGADCHHMHHNCGDDSPPPTITGFNSYLEGIPNTGVIRYDDASFLKNLIPGQNLNNEVSIHNINDSNFTRSTTSPVAHRVEITPVFPNRPTSTNIYEHCSTSSGVAAAAAAQQQSEQHQQNFVANSGSTYRENMTDYGNDTNSIFAPNNLLNLSELDSVDRDVESFKRFNYDFEPPTEKQKVIIDLNDLLIKKSPHSHRTSPSSYRLDESTLDNFVQNISALQISAPTTGEEQCSPSSAAQLHNVSNGGAGSGGGGGVGGGGSSDGATSANTTNGWW